MSTTRIPNTNPISNPEPNPCCCYPARILANFAIWWGVFLTPAYVLAVGLSGAHVGAMVLPAEPPLAGLAMTVLAAWIGEGDPRVRGPARLALACNAVPVAIIAASWMIRVGFV